ncbi:MAG: aminomethyl-transferring glycine dehydrogenase [Bdellovibrionota bacterium]|nr:MAG: glycine dehydrogenase (aminomethyl-transferring) [Pseudomonadota bacterium]
MSMVWDKANTIQNFAERHIGPSEAEVKAMLSELGYASLDALTKTAIPKAIQTKVALDLPLALTEHEALAELSRIMKKNKVYKSFIGLGYYDTITPSVIQRNILENPAWYTQYTPYQPEIAQGRLEALINFQTLVTDLTGLPIANASLLDEGTAAAEAMTMSRDICDSEQGQTYLIAADCHPQTIEVVRTRAEALGIPTKIVAPAEMTISKDSYGVLLQYPNTNGTVEDYEKLIAKAKSEGLIVTLATDLLALCVLKSPGELGADIAVGTSQRFGVPLGYGGPHAGFFSTKDEYKRRIPGRLVGVSKDAQGAQAYRLSLQTREQHIRRDKATSNICTAQVLLAIMASMYAVYHGPKGLKVIAERTHAMTGILATGLKKLGYKLLSESYFDTITVLENDNLINQIEAAAEGEQINFRKTVSGQIGISFDEKTQLSDIERILTIFALGKPVPKLQDLSKDVSDVLPKSLVRKSTYLQHPVFNAYHSETEMMRYIRKLEGRDLSLTRSMIPLGSCTMKLNAASELYPITWPEVNSLHPFVPLEQAAGYLELFHTLENYLAACTGFDAISLQPNSGAQGEYAGLLVLRKYHISRGEGHRTVCLIPSSAHGTNPASAVMAGMEVVVTRCDKNGNIDVEDLKAKAIQHKDRLAALMITYPSTHGVFEEDVVKICDIIHENGGQVYMDGANLNAQVGLSSPGKFGPDVCHMNLHKTFCIPHGGGGPGVGPIGVKSHLAKFLPNHPVVKMGGTEGVGPISAAPWGSASILPISWMYIRMMGGEDLKRATQIAILNANYIAKRLDPHFPVVYRGESGLVAHECIIDLNKVKKSADVSVDDIAKRLMDYGYHAPTVSWPVPNTMMIEPTESECKREIDRFCDTMISIRSEIAEIEQGKVNRENNALKNAPHTAPVMMGAWDRPYSREQAAFPKEWVKESKFWPFVGRIDSAFGDRNLVCTCPDISTYES